MGQGAPLWTPRRSVVYALISFPHGVQSVKAYRAVFNQHPRPSIAVQDQRAQYVRMSVEQARELLLSLEFALSDARSAALEDDAEDRQAEHEREPWSVEFPTDPQAPV